MKPDLKELEAKFKKQIESYTLNLASVRVGRANPAILDRIHADYYGTPTLLNQMAEIKVPDARTIMITPWETKSLKEIEKAINLSDLGINPVNDGKSIKLSIPPLTEDSRKQLTKQVAKMGEDIKVHLRNVRRDAIDKFKDMKKKSEISEDELKTTEKSVQDMLDKFIKEVDVITAKKDKEMMEI